MRSEAALIRSQQIGRARNSAARRDREVKCKEQLSAAGDSLSRAERRGDDGAFLAGRSPFLR